MADMQKQVEQVRWVRSSRQVKQARFSWATDDEPNRKKKKALEQSGGEQER